MINQTPKQRPATLLPVDYGAISPALKDVPRWLLWQYSSDNRKVPYDPNKNGAYGSSTNPETWASFFVALQQYKERKTDGIGFVFTEEDNIVGIDIDHCRDPETGELNEFATLVLANIPGYAEVSPSQTGIKLFTRSNDLLTGTNHEVGLECYSKGRYFTVTGQVIKQEFPDHAISTSFLHQYMQKRAIGKVLAFNTAPDPDYDATRIQTELLSKLDPDESYDLWLTVGMALHHQFEGSDEGLNLWDLWSNQDGTSVKYDPRACEAKWNSFAATGGLTIKTLRYEVGVRAKKEALANGEVVWDSELTTARQYLELLWRDEDGTPCLINLESQLYRYQRGQWEAISDLWLERECQDFLANVKEVNRVGQLVPLKVTNSRVVSFSKVVAREAAVPEVTSSKFWIDGSTDDLKHLIPMSNGLLNFKTGELMPNTARLFTNVALPFAYDPHAKCPNWLAFLNSLFPNDEQGQQAFAQMFGYILAGDASLQKLFQIVGPKRSGKGTILRVLSSLLGVDNVYSCASLEMLTTNFGLSPLIGKSLLTIPDAQMPQSKSQAEIAAMLLSISGQDLMTIDRKYKSPISVKPNARILLCANKPLQIVEGAGALASRFINFELKHSFYGKEDYDLDKKLESELSGIFVWAMQADMARAGGRLIEPISGQGLVDEVTEATQPLHEFYEACVIQDPDKQIFRSDLYSVYVSWAMKNGTRPIGSAAFTTNFKAYLRNLNGFDQRRKINPARNNVNEYYYHGLGLTPYGQACSNGTVDFTS